MGRLLRVIRSLIVLLLLSAVGLSELRAASVGGVELLVALGIAGYVLWRLVRPARRLMPKPGVRPTRPILPTPAAWVPRRSDGKRRRTL